MHVSTAVGFLELVLGSWSTATDSSSRAQAPMRRFVLSARDRATLSPRPLRVGEAAPTLGLDTPHASRAQVRTMPGSDWTPPAHPAAASGSLTGTCRAEASWKARARAATSWEACWDRDRSTRCTDGAPARNPAGLLFVQRPRSPTRKPSATLRVTILVLVRFINLVCQRGSTSNVVTTLAANTHSLGIDWAPTEFALPGVPRILDRFPLHR
mmetsp:Transcript_105900/g.299357  ORF Transcript_105900/g.299357 Transcript_105900/m.299357 type:complete len:212 (-) Transcript_105900:51-686(-)